MVTVERRQEGSIIEHLEWAVQVEVAQHLIVQAGQALSMPTQL
jgi:hypothetical protein